MQTSKSTTFHTMVSIVVPVYNVESYLRECLDSVLAQTFSDWECICVDDGATDDSPTILAEYAERDSRFRIIRQSNGGLSAARNTGMDAANGTYVYFLDSDDMLVPDALRRMTETMDGLQLDELVFGTELLVEEGAATAEMVAEKARFYSICPAVIGQRLAGHELFGCLVHENSFFASVPLRCFRRDAIPSWLRFPTGVIHEDEYFSPLALLSAKTASAIADKLYVRRLRKGSITTEPGAAKKHAQALRQVTRMLVRDAKQFNLLNQEEAAIRRDVEILRKQAYHHIGFPKSILGKLFAFWRIGGFRLLVSKVTGRCSSISS